MTPKDLAALFALAAVWGASFLFIRVAAPAPGPFPLVAGRVLLAAAVLWAGLRALGMRPALRPHARPTGAAFPALLALSLLCTTVAYVLYFRLVASVGPTRTATVTYLSPVFGALWGALFLGERVTAGMLGGLACVLTSVVLANDVRASRLLSRPVPARADGPAST